MSHMPAMHAGRSLRLLRNAKIETDPNAKEQDTTMSANDGTRIEELCAELDNIAAEASRRFPSFAHSLRKG